MAFPGKGWFSRKSGGARLPILSTLSHLAQEGTQEETLEFCIEVLTGFLSARRVILFIREKDGYRGRVMSGVLDRLAHPPFLPLDPLMERLSREGGNPPYKIFPSFLESLGFSPERTYFLPLLDRKTPVGLIVLERNRTEPLKEEEETLLHIFQPLIASLLKQSLLLEELSQRHAELESLLEVVQKINEESHPGRVLSTILEHAIARTGATSGSLIFVDSIRKKLKILAQQGLPPNIEKSLVLDIGQGITGWVAREKKPLLVEDVRKDPRYVCAKEEVRSELAVPIFFAGEVVGVLNVDHRELRAFQETHLRFLSTLAGLIAAKLSLVFQTLKSQGEEHGS